MLTMKFTKRFPRLSTHISHGTIFVADGAYNGRASDGEIVQIAIIGEEKSAERYLETHNSPEQW
jgi:hypothetical protein